MFNIPIGCLWIIMKAWLMEASYLIWFPCRVESNGHFLFLAPCKMTNCCPRDWHNPMSELARPLCLSSNKSGGEWWLATWERGVQLKACQNPGLLKGQRLTKRGSGRNCDRHLFKLPIRVCGLNHGGRQKKKKIYSVPLIWFHQEALTATQLSAQAICLCK